MLKKSASRRSPLFGLFGLSRLFGFWLNETNQMNQINKTNQFEHPAWHYPIALEVGTIEFSPCRNSFSADLSSGQLHHGS
jgi:hypothetical protein